MSKHQHKCESCGSIVSGSNVIEQFGDSYLCLSCDREAMEEAEKRYEDEEWYELNRIESSIRYQ